MQSSQEENSTRRVPTDGISAATIPTPLLEAQTPYHHVSADTTSTYTPTSAQISRYSQSSPRPDEAFRRRSVTDYDKSSFALRKRSKTTSFFVSVHTSAREKEDGTGCERPIHEGSGVSTSRSATFGIILASPSNAKTPPKSLMESSSPLLSCVPVSPSVSHVPTSMSRRRLASNMPALHSKVTLPPLVLFPAPSSPSIRSPGSFACASPLSPPLPLRQLVSMRNMNGAASPVTPADQLLHTPLAPPEIPRQPLPKPRNLSSLNLSFHYDTIGQSPDAAAGPLLAVSSKNLPRRISDVRGSSSQCPDIATTRRASIDMPDHKVPKSQKVNGGRVLPSPLRNPLAGCNPSRARPPALRLPMSRRLSYNHCLSAPLTPTPLRLEHGLASPAVIRSLQLSLTSQGGPSMVAAVAQGSDMPFYVGRGSPTVLVDSPGYFSF